MKLMKLFKKKKVESIPEDKDHISIKNLESYVVEVYEKNKRLQKEIDALEKEEEANRDRYDEKCKELDVCKTLLSEKEKSVKQLEKREVEMTAENEEYKKSIRHLKNKSNELEIANRQMNEKNAVIERDEKAKGYAEFREKMTDKIEQHKGNLSKQTVLKYLDQTIIPKHKY